MNHPGGAPIQQSTAEETDSLLQTLLWVCERYGIKKTPTSFLTGVPLNERLQLEHGMRAMELSGFAVSLVKRNPSTLPPSLLPAVLLCKDQSAIVLLAVNKINNNVRFELNVAGENVFMTEPELRKIYNGHTLLIKQLPKIGEAGDDSEEKPKDIGSTWLWKVVWVYRRYYYDSIVAAVLINVLSTFTGLFAIHVYDRIIPLKAYSTLWSLLVGVGIAILFLTAATLIRDFLMDLAARKADLTLSATLFRQALGLKLENTPPSSGVFAHQVRQFETVRNFGTSASLAVVTDLPFAFIFIFMIYSVAGNLALVPSVAIVISLIVAWFVQYPLHKHMLKTYRDSAAMMGVLIESIEGIETIRVTGSSGIMTKKYEELAATSAYSGMRFRILSNIVNTFFSMVSQTVNITILVWGVYLVHDGNLTTGALVGSMMFAGRALQPVGTFVGLATQWQTCKTAMGGLNNLMNAPLEREPTRSYLQKPEVDGAIEVSKLSFHYPKSHENPNPPLALNNANVKIAPGEKVAFVGKIGSGKSTLLRMIAGLFSPISGQVKIDGIDIRQIDPVDFRTQLGYVTQDLRLFRGTLRDNIYLGRTAATDEAFMEVVKLTGLDKIADAHPMGYDLPIGNGGVGLSGGQRQLVALARALITRPGILLMDEPTSAMDMQTEAMFTKRLGDIVANRTVIIVTHRPSLLGVVDRIVVLDTQKIVADGPKEKILKMLAGQKSNAVQEDENLLKDGSKDDRRKKEDKE